jgi:hypothetical protein
MNVQLSGKTLFRYLRVAAASLNRSSSHSPDRPANVRTCWRRGEDVVAVASGSSAKAAST